MFKINKRNLMILIAVVVVIIFFTLVRSCKNKPKVTYEFEKVSYGMVSKTISASGTLGLLEEFVLICEIIGEVDKIYVEHNEGVKKDQILMKIKSDVVDEELRNYTDTYRLIKMELASYYQEYLTQRKLYQEELISRREYETGKFKYEQKKNQYKTVQEKYENLLEAVKNKIVKAPTDGIVMQRWVEERMPVKRGTKLFLLTNSLDKMQLVINVDETDIGFIKTSQIVSFTVSAYPDKVFEGFVDQVRLSPVKRQGIVVYESVVICENSENLLRPGMTATATVNIEKKDNVMRVPNQALISAPIEKQIRPGERYVWIEDKKSKEVVPMTRVKVKTGLTGDYYTEINSGKLKEGDKALIGVHQNILN